MESVVKWKYRVVKPGEKHHTIDGYIDYVEKQVEERRNNNGVFVVNEKDIIGLNDQIQIDPDDFEQSLYLNYINERKGSRGCFSDQEADVNSLVSQLKKHEGAVWIPIVSLKEDWARQYGLDSEVRWMEKARELAEEYRKELGIAPANYKWIAAFHSKSEAEQNPLTDSGCQPHLHFMIWEDEPTRSKYTLKHEAIERIRQRTGSILSREYMEKFYKERNQLRDDIINSSKLDINNFAEEVRFLAMNVNVLMGGKGKLTVGDIEKRRNIAVQILDKTENGVHLSSSEQYYSEMMDIDSPSSARRAISNYNYVLDRLNSLSDKVMNTELLQQWFEISDQMRASQHDPEKSTLSDYSDMRRVVSNNILKQVKTISKDNTFIKDEFRGMLLERLELGSFRKNLSEGQIKTDLAVITSLCKTAGMDEKLASEAQRTLLERSQMEKYYAYLQHLVEEYYRMLQYGFDVTSRDFWQTMKDLRVPISQVESQFMSYKSNTYGIANSVILEPVASNVMLVNNSASIMSGKGGKSIMNIGVSDLAFIPKTKEDYEAKYNSLLDSLSSYDQSSLEYEKEELELY